MEKRLTAAQAAALVKDGCTLVTHRVSTVLAAQRI